MSKPKRQPWEIFTADDFSLGKIPWDLTVGQLRAACADAANAKMRSLYESWPKAWLCEENGISTAHLAQPVDATHVLRCAFIEPIEQPKPCEHEPAFCEHTLGDAAIIYHPICKKCGAKLKACWEVAE